MVYSKLIALTGGVAKKFVALILVALIAYLKGVSDGRSQSRTQQLEAAINQLEIGNKHDQEINNLSDAELVKRVRDRWGG